MDVSRTRAGCRRNHDQLRGDTNQAAQFARSVPDFVLKGRFADLVKLDLQALEQEMGSTSRRRDPGGAASFGGERRLVEFPHGKPIFRPRADNAWMKPRRPGAWPGLGRDLKPLPIWRGTESSNPSPSSGESVSRLKPLSYVENPDFPRGCARLAWRLDRPRRAGCFDTAATGGNQKGRI